MKIGDKVKYIFSGQEHFGVILWLKDSLAVVLDDSNFRREINFSDITVI